MSPLPSKARLWFGVGAAPVSWSTTEIAGYVLAGQSCTPAWNNGQAFGVTHPGIWVVGLALLMGTIGCAGLFVAIDNIRHSAAVVTAPSALDVFGDQSATATRIRFMSTAGVLTSTLFLLGTLLFSVPSLMGDLCTVTR